jgi:phosphoribosylformylglycinamidine cyclo-ligase
MREESELFSQGFDPIHLMDFNQPQLISSTSYLGEKIDCARQMGKFTTIGEDLIAQACDQVAESGATPLYISYSIEGVESSSQIFHEILRGIERGSQRAGVKQIVQSSPEGKGRSKGELMASVVATGALELDKKSGSHRVKAGDVIVAMPSSGMHASGFALVNELITRYQIDHSSHYDFDKSLGDLLLTPPEIYTLDCMALIKAQPENIHAFALIADGGVAANTERLIPDGLVAIYDRSTWSLPREMKFLAEVASLTLPDLEQSWNAGIGMSVIVESSVADLIVRSLSARGMKAWIAGRVEKAEEKGAPRAYLTSEYQR